MGYRCKNNMGEGGIRYFHALMLFHYAALQKRGWENRVWHAEATKQNYENHQLGKKMVKGRKKGKETHTVSS